MVLPSPDTLEDDATLKQIFFIASLLSVVGAILIMLSFASTRALRTHPTNLVFWLALCDFFFSLNFIVSIILPWTLYCIPSAVVAQVCGVASISWNGAISFNILLTMLNPFRDTKTLVKYYHLLIWTGTAGSAVVLYFLDALGADSDGTCWIKQTSSLNFYHLFVFVPLMICFLLAITAVVVLAVRAHVVFALESTRTKRAALYRMWGYTLLFILCWTAPCVHRMAVFFGYSPRGLVYADAAGMAAQGFANSLMWLTNPTFVREWRNKCGCCGDSRSSQRLLDALQDSRLDHSKLAALLRKNIVRCLLQGVQHAVRGTPRLLRAAQEEIERAAADAASQDEDPTSEATRLMFGQDAVMVPPSSRGPSGAPPLRSNVFRRKAVYQLRSDVHSVDSDRDNIGFTLVDYAPVVFHHLRLLDAIDLSSYEESLNPRRTLTTFSEKFSEGRSGSFFLTSADGRYIIKTLPRAEAHTLRSILPEYYNHLCCHRRSLLVRFYGLYCLKVFGRLYYFVIMKNIFATSKPIHERFDLKGSWVRRSAGKARLRDKSVLGMDNDFAGRRLLIGEERKAELVALIDCDTEFLEGLNIIDYSLLMGIHNTTQPLAQEEERSSDDPQDLEAATPQVPAARGGTDMGNLIPCELCSADNGREIYYIGLIDVLTEYSLSKKMERWVKVRLMCKDPQGLSVQPPAAYGSRFREYMRRIIA